MPGQGKEIKKRIKSVRSTRKITRTMELVATSKMKRAQQRVLAAQPYLTKLEEVLGDLANAGVKVEHPLLASREVKASLIFLVVSNRGLCGGYNANLIRMARDLYRKLKAEGKEALLYAIGKKALTYFKFVGIPVFKSNVSLNDRPTYEDAQAFAAELIELFTSGKVDQVYVVSSHYKSAGSQPPRTFELLPLRKGGVEGGPGKDVAKKVTMQKRAEYLFEPSPEKILAELLPLSVKNSLYRVLIEAACNEQIARRVAMKNATDAAEEMQRMLTLKLNKARQASITQELSEIVGGAAALD